MRNLAASIYILLLLAVVTLTMEHYDPKRTHLVDVGKDISGRMNFLFRGNMPVNKSNEFAIDELRTIFKQRAAEKGYSLPDDVYVIDVSLNNIFNPGFWVEAGFWKSAPASQGKFINWPLGLAGILPPNMYNSSQVKEMANKSSPNSVWLVDQIPSRIVTLHSMLYQSWPRSAAVYVHCTAGCDRTGEVIGSYRINYQTQNLTQMYSLDTVECGRSPNYFSTGALEWYCYTWTYEHHPIGNCEGFASCDPFGDCHPTGQP